MTHVVLIEALPKGFVPDAHALLVAVTPSAAAALDASGFQHRVLADLVDEGGLAALEDDYFAQQLRWLDTLDALLRSRVPELAAWQTGVPFFYTYYLKMLLDSVFIRGYEATEILASRPSRITLLRADLPEPPRDATLYLRGPSVFSRLLPRFCEAADVQYGEELVEVALAKAVAPALPGRRAFRIGPALDRAIGAAFSFAPRRRTFAFVSTLYDAGDLLSRARRRGHRCLLVHDDTIDDLGRLRARPVADLSTTPTPWTEAADELTADGSPLWAWPDSWHGVPLRDVLAPSLRHFVEHVAPALAADATRLSEALDSLDVDFVINPYMVNVREGAAAAAARLSPRAESVVIEHGDAVFAAKEIDLALLLGFDHVFVGNGELASYYEARRREYARPTAKVHLGSYRWSAVARGARRRAGRPPDPLPSRRPVAVYVVTGSGGDLRYLNSAWYSDAWYYRLQATIVDALAGRDDYEVVLKTFPGENIRSPIADYARAKSMTVSSSPFTKWLPFADRVVIDFPSTAFYECALAGVPTLGLLYRHFHTRPGPVAEFGRSLAPFETADEAAALVDEFLSAPTWSTPRLPVPKEDILRTLERL